jgi:ADP-heptose:LPS heptosyltransferase
VRSLLAIRLGGLGDLLCVLPSLRLIRAAFPGRRVVLRARAEYGSLLRERGVADEVRPADGRDPGPAEAEARIGWFQRSSSISDGPGRFFVFDPTAGKSVARFFFDRTEAFVREAGYGGAVDFDAFVRLPGALPGARSGPAMIHPGSGSVRKRWPLDRFLALAEEIGRRDCPGRFVTGEAEEEIAGALRAARLPPGWELLHAPSLSDLAARLETAPLYVGNDSGVTHLAAACGAPSVALFRTEFAFFWRPAAPAVILAAGEVEGIPLEAAVSAAAASLSSAVANRCAMITTTEGE